MDNTRSLKRSQNEQTDGDTDATVCNVERWPVMALVIKVEKIGDGPLEHTVSQISQDAACQKSDCDLGGCGEPLLVGFRVAAANQKVDNEDEGS